MTQCEIMGGRCKDAPTGTCRQAPKNRIDNNNCASPRQYMTSVVWRCTQAVHPLSNAPASVVWRCRQAVHPLTKALAHVVCSMLKPYSWVPMFTAGNMTKKTGNRHVIDHFSHTVFCLQPAVSIHRDNYKR